jgi:hypothetical protein
MRGQPAALAILPDGKLRKSYQKALDAAHASFWRPDKVWEAWPIAGSGYLQVLAPMTARWRRSCAIAVQLTANCPGDKSPVCSQLQMGPVRRRRIHGELHQAAAWMPVSLVPQPDGSIIPSRISLTVANPVISVSTDVAAASSTRRNRITYSPTNSASTLDCASSQSKQP